MDNIFTGQSARVGPGLRFEIDAKNLTLNYWISKEGLL